MTLTEADRQKLRALREYGESHLLGVAQLQEYLSTGIPDTFSIRICADRMNITFTVEMVGTTKIRHASFAKRGGRPDQSEVKAIIAELGYDRPLDTYSMINMGPAVQVIDIVRAAQP